MKTFTRIVPSASKLNHLKACQWWARPEVTAPPLPTSEEAEHGTRVHAQIEAWIVEGTLPNEMQARAAVAEIMGRALDTRSMASEVAFALDPFTGYARGLRSGRHRDYSEVEPNEIAGTADLVAYQVEEDGGIKDVHVIDFKTGRVRHSAADSLQLAFFAICVAQIYNVDHVTVELWWLTEDGEVDTDWYEMDALDIDTARMDIAALMTMAYDADPTPGSHCRYCPARTVCPAISDKLAEVAASKPVLPKRKIPLLLSHIEDDAHASWAYEQLRAIQGATESAWGALRAWVDVHGSIKLPNHKRYTKKTMTREYIDCGKPAQDVLRRELGPSWMDAVTVSTSKAAIKRAAQGRPEPIATVLRHVLEQLREVDAIEERELTRYEEVDDHAV